MQNEEGLTRYEMYMKLYMLKQVGDEVTVLEGLVSSESFALHRDLCNQLTPQIKMYKTYLAKYGELHPMVKKMKQTYDDAMKYLKGWKKLNAMRDRRLAEFGMSTTTKAFVTPLRSAPNSAANSATNSPMKTGKRTASEAAESSAPAAKRVSPVSTPLPQQVVNFYSPLTPGAQPPLPPVTYAPADVAPMASLIQAAESSQYYEQQVASPSVNQMYAPYPVQQVASPSMNQMYAPYPVQQVASPSMNTDQLSSKPGSPMNMRGLFDALDEEEWEEATAQNIDDDEEISDDEEPTAEDLAFIADDE